MPPLFRTFAPSKLLIETLTGSWARTAKHSNFTGWTFIVQHWTSTPNLNLDVLLFFRIVNIFSRPLVANNVWHVTHTPARAYFPASILYPISSCLVKNVERAEYVVEKDAVLLARELQRMVCRAFTSAIHSGCIVHMIFVQYCAVERLGSRINPLVRKVFHKTLTLVVLVRTFWQSTAPSPWY